MVLSEVAPKAHIPKLAQLVTYAVYCFWKAKVTTYVTEILESVYRLKFVSPQRFRRWTCLRLLRRIRKRANHSWCVPYNGTVIEIMDNVQDMSCLLQNTRVKILYSGSRHLYFSKI